MRKLFILLLAVLALTFTSCVFEGTGTVHLDNDTVHTITAVNFVAVSGGTTENHATNILAGEDQTFYSVEPGIYDITLTVDTVGTFIAWNDNEIKEGTWHLRTINDSDLP
jgi:hypothetical protein